MLTEAGQAFLDEARLTLAQAERAAKAARQAIEGQKQLVIGFSICAFNHVLPDIIQAFRQEYPDRKVTLTEMSTVMQVQALLNGEIDIGFLYTPIEQAQITTMTLVREPLVVALPAEHPLAAQTVLNLRVLAQEPFILCSQHVKPDLYNHFMNACQRAGFHPNIVQEASPPEVLLGLVESGMGIALTAAGGQTRHKVNVVYRPLKEPVPMLEIAAAWRRGQTSKILEEFIQFLQKRCYLMNELNSVGDYA